MPSAGSRFRLTGFGSPSKTAQMKFAFFILLFFFATQGRAAGNSSGSSSSSSSGGPFGFKAESIKQIENSAWLVTHPYYFNGTTKYWISIDARPESDEDPELGDRNICKKLGFREARTETRVAAYPWIDSKTYNVATINSSAGILGLDTDVIDVAPNFIYLRLICTK